MQPAARGEPAAVNARFPFGFSRPPLDGNSGRAADVALARNEARTTQAVPTAVAPGCTITAADGTVLKAGDELRLEHLSGNPHYLHAAIELGLVIKIAADEIPYRAPSAGRDRYRIGKKCIGGKERPLEPGWWVCGDDFKGQEGAPAMPALPATLTPDGRIVAAQEARPERPAITGQQVMLNLLSKGYVVDTWATGEKNAARGTV